MPEPPLLSILHDIHTPAGVSWWPLAVGWWLLLILAIVLMLLLIRHWYRGNRLRREAMAELKRIRSEIREHGQHNRLSMQVNILLRRVALTLALRTLVAGLMGQRWLRFLDQRGGQGEFSRGPGRVLSQAPYALDPEVDSEALLKLAERWIRSNL